jgi:hypothetical protein
MPKVSIPRGGGLEARSASPGGAVERLVARLSWHTISIQNPQFNADERPSVAGACPETCPEDRKRMVGLGEGSVKKNEDFLFFAVDLIQIAGFMLNQRKNEPSSSR